MKTMAEEWEELDRNLRELRRAVKQSLVGDVITVVLVASAVRDLLRRPR